MNSLFKALRVGLLAALIPFVAFAADPAQADLSPTPSPTGLHEVGTADDDDAPAPVPTPAGVVSPTLVPSPALGPTPHHRSHEDNDDDNRVDVFGSVYVGPQEVVAGNSVSVFGPLVVDGAVSQNSVSVFGSTTINGTVRGNVVAVFGKIHLGPNSRVEGSVTDVGGAVVRTPGAYVGEGINHPVSGFDIDDDSAAMAWWRHGLRMGRPLAFGPHLFFFWLFTLGQVAIYLVLVLVFPNGIRRCGDTLAHRPGLTLLTGVLALLALPILFILLLVTVVGIPVALVVLPLSVIASVIFGKTALYALLGRSIIGRQHHPALALLVGLAIFMACYAIPVLGLLLWCTLGFLGFACSLTALFTSGKPVVTAVPMVVPAPPAPPAASTTGTPAALAVAELPQDPAAPSLGVLEIPLAAMAAAPPAPTFAAALPPLMGTSPALVPELSLARAGFWIRMLALLVDVILVGVITQMHETHLFFLVLAVYGAVLWKIKGATVGGIIFGLKVIRIDGKPAEWTTMIVRSLACFFSLIVAGLGFIWIAFDPEKQAWHDKIAGTVVVRLPKGVSLV